jgi:predicted amidohydrolase YtcJ
MAKLRAALLAAALAASGGCARSAPADLVIRNARVYTVEPEQPWAEAVAVRGERIVWVGADGDAERFVGDGTRAIDAGGRLLLPGFIDSHNHVQTGADPEILSLFGATSLAEIQSRVREFAQARPDLSWIEGEGWNYSAMPQGRLPDAGDLEGLSGGRPAFLMAYDYHTAWLNREGLRALGITAATERVSFAQAVEKNPQTGEPTGILLGLSTLALGGGGEAELARHLPSHSPERRYRRLQDTLRSAVRYGITTLVEPQASLEDLETFARARERGDLRSRLQVALFHPPGLPEAELERFASARQRFDDDHLRVSAVKLYIDDVIEAHTAAMLEPYADLPGESGTTIYAPEEFAALVTSLDARGFQLFIHAIGDRGVRTALDALEAARSANGARDSRHQLVHVETISSQDVPRFAALGVVACMQPRHSAPDLSARWAAAVGPERGQRAFAWRSLHEAGAHIAFASDWNVAEMDPLVAIYTARTRKGLDGRPEGGWIPEQTVDLETALRAYSLGGAFANFVEADRGSIASGKYADLILLSDDLFAIPPERIKDARVVLTLVGGQVVHRAF